MSTVNVGTIGHVDHGKTTLTAALLRVLGEERAAEVVVMDAEGIAVARRVGLIRDSLKDAVDGFNDGLFGRSRDPGRKADRKARMRALQARAFSRGSAK